MSTTVGTVGTPGAIKQSPTAAGFLGQGVSWPLQLNAQGRLAMSWGVALVEEALRQIFSTAQGERAMLPDYGSATAAFEPPDLARTVAKFKQDVAAYEPRVEYVVLAPQLGPGVNEVTVDCQYKLRDEANERTLTLGVFNGP